MVGEIEVWCHMASREEAVKSIRNKIILFCVKTPVANSKAALESDRHLRP